MSNWDTVLKKSTTNISASKYIEICHCHNPERFLRYDINSKEYYGEGGCEIDFICAKLQIKRHKGIVVARKKRLCGEYLQLMEKKPPNGRKSVKDQTLDQFF